MNKNVTGIIVVLVVAGVAFLALRPLVIKERERRADKKRKLRPAPNGAYRAYSKLNKI